MGKDGSGNTGSMGWALLPSLHPSRLFLLLLMLASVSEALAAAASSPLDPLVVAYLAPGASYTHPPLALRDLVRNGGASFLDQINYARAAVTEGRCSIADPLADLQAPYGSEESVDGSSDRPDSPFRGYFHQLQELKQRYPNIRILISLQGTAASFKEDAKPERLQEFVRSCVDIFLRGRFAPGVTEPNLFDGIDVDWEFPLQEDAENFAGLLQEFRRQMDAYRDGLTLAVAVGDQPQMQPGTDFRSIVPLVNEFGIMNYNYTGPWEPTTGFLAPLFPSADGPGEYGSVAESIAAYREAGIPSAKLLMGIPFFGYQWKSVAPANHGLFQPGKPVSKDKPYREIRALQFAYSLFRNPISRAPWLFDGANFWTFEDPVSIDYKCRYATQQQLGGIMIWEVGSDTAEATLLTKAWHSLHHSPASPVLLEPNESDDQPQRGSKDDGA